MIPDVLSLSDQTETGRARAFSSHLNQARSYFSLCVRSRNLRETNLTPGIHPLGCIFVFFFSSLVVGINFEHHAVEWLKSSSLTRN